MINDNKKIGCLGGKRQQNYDYDPLIAEINLRVET